MRVQFPPLERFTFQPEADSLDRVEELAESMVRLAGIRQDFLRISREGDLEATGQGRLPIDQVPLAVSKPILSALHEGRLDTKLRTDQVPPLVPGRVKRKRQRDRVQDHFRFSPAVTIDGIAIEELDLPEGSPKSPLPTIREERQDLLGEKGLTVWREFTGGEQRAKAAVREQRGRIGVEKQGLIAGSEIRVREEIEGAFDGLQLVFGRSIGLKFEQSHLESKPEIHRSGRGNRPQQVVKSLLFAAGTPSIAEVEVVANGFVGKVNVPDAKPAVGDRRSHEVFVSLVRLWLCHIADRREVEFPWTPRCVLNNAEFSYPDRRRWGRTRSGLTDE